MVRSIAVVAVVLGLAGCGGDGAPALTEAEGVVLLNSQPLPFAKVTFNPTQVKSSGQAAATAVTDENGRFKLSVGGKPGAVPGENIVTVIEGPPPEDARGQDAQDKLTAYQAKLKNRPIPQKYANTNSSDVRITVTKDQKEYKVDLTR